MDTFDFMMAVIAGLIANWLFQLLYEKRRGITGATVSEWLSKSLESSRTLLPLWFRRFISKKYGLDSPGKFVLDKYMRGEVSETLMPESPMYVSSANGSVLLETLRYAAGHPDRISCVFDFALRFARNGVFNDSQAADEFLSQVETSGANRGVQMTVVQPVWSEMTEEQQRSVTIPGELIDEYLKNIGVWFMLSRLVVFSSVFVSFLWLI